MYIKTVELKNVGQFESLERNLDKGLIGIVGRNGSGKTTFVNSIYAALTNDFSRLAPVKAEAIRNGSTGPSYIRIIGTHQNQEFRLTRYLRPNKQELVTPERTYTANGDIVSYFENQLNISKTTIDNYVFVDQWAMFDFIMQNEAERAKLFQHICGLTKALDIYKTCDTFLARNKLAVVIDNRAELEMTLAELNKQIQKVTTEKQQLETQLLDPVTIRELRGQIGLYARRPELEATVLSLGGKINQTETTLTTEILPTLENLTRELKAQQEGFSELEAKQKQAEKLVANYRAQQSLGQLLTQKQLTLKTTGEQLEKRKAALQDLVTPDDLIEEAGLQTVQQKIWRLEGQVKDYADILANKTCPVCQQPIPKREETEAKKKAAEQQAAMLSAQLQASESYWTAVNDQKHKQNQLEQLQAQTLKDIGDITLKMGKAIPEKTYDNASNFLKQFKEIQDALTLCQTQKTNKEHEKQLQENQLKLLQKQLEDVRVRLKDCPQSVTVQETRLRQHETDRSAYDTAVGLLTGLQANQRNVQTSYNRLVEQLAANEKRNQKIATIERVKDAFHWNKLPKLVTTANLKLLCADINEILSLFEDPFYVEADEELSFRAYFPGRESVSAKQLSGGQKISLAIAFRMALDKIFGGNVGLLCLDEPTVGLDVDNLKNFHEILQCLALGVNRQVIMITHNEGFSSCFSQTIRMHD